MPEPTIAEIDALVGPATPHFAYQLRARVEELVRDLPADDPVRRYGEQQMELLDAGAELIREVRGRGPDESVDVGERGLCHRPNPNRR